MKSRGQESLAEASRWDSTGREREAGRQEEGRPTQRRAQVGGKGRAILTGRDQGSRPELSGRRRAMCLMPWAEERL